MGIFGIALNGLQQSEANMNQAATKIGAAGAASLSPGGPSPATVDLSTNVVGLITAKDQAEVNLRTLKTGDELWQSTINLIG